MKTLYILIVVVMVALALGCVGNKQDGTKTQIPPAQTSPAATSPTIAPQGAAPAPTNGEDLFGTEGDIAAMDSILNDSLLDTTLSSSI